MVSKAILVVDDSATIRKFVSSCLMAGGYRVVTACDGLEALEKLPSEDVGLIITDLNMPDMDGFELMRNLRESPAHKSTPVIVLSSVSNEDEKLLARRMGAVCYVEKPFEPDKILREVVKIMSPTDRKEP